MIEGPYFVLVVAGVLGTARSVLRFSAFVMRGLAALPPATAALVYVLALA